MTFSVGIMLLMGRAVARAQRAKHPPFMRGFRILCVRLALCALAVIMWGRMPPTPPSRAPGEKNLCSVPSGQTVLSPALSTKPFRQGERSRGAFCGGSCRPHPPRPPPVPPIDGGKSHPPPLKYEETSIYSAFIHNIFDFISFLKEWTSKLS